MKLLEVPTFVPLNELLNKKHGEYHISGSVEAFSCKPVGIDKKVTADMISDPEVISLSPHGTYESEVVSPKILANLVQTLNHSFPDYDFSAAEARHFQKLMSLELVQNSINTSFKELVFNAPADTSKNEISETYDIEIEEIWNSIDRQIDLKTCEIYTYTPDPDSNPLQEEGYIWSFNYFFYNRKWKMLVFMRCSAISDIHSPTMPLECFNNDEFDLIAEDEDNIFVGDSQIPMDEEEFL